MLKTVLQLDYVVLQRPHILLVLINFNYRKKDKLLQMCTFSILHISVSHSLASPSRRKVSDNTVGVANVGFGCKIVVHVS